MPTMLRAVAGTREREREREQARNGGIVFTSAAADMAGAAFTLGNADPAANLLMAKKRKKAAASEEEEEEEEE